MLRRFEAKFRRIVREEGLQTTDGAVGVLATGTVNIATVNTLITAMPEGTFELVSHPGYRDECLARANTRLLESREIERNALMAIKDFRGIDLISFAGLGQSVCPAAEAAGIMGLPSSLEPSDQNVHSPEP